MAAKVPRPPALTEAEWTVMNALWACAPATTRVVHDAVNAATGWAYTTVKTMLERLEAKGAVASERTGGADVYTPRLQRDRARTAALRGLLARAFGGAPAALAHFLLGSERLSVTEREELRRLLADVERRGGD